MTRHHEPRFCRRDPARRAPTLPERLKTAADDCWRAGQLVAFFMVAALVFGEPPPPPPTFTSTGATLTGARGAIAADVQPMDRGPVPELPLDPGVDRAEDRRL